MPGKKPMLTEAHCGAMARRLSLLDDCKLTYQQAQAAREKERGSALSLKERRDFRHGWHLGLYHYALGELQIAGKYLRNAELEDYGEVLFEQARDLGFARSISELEAALKNKKIKQSKHKKKG